MHNVMKNILRFIFILFLIFLSLPIFSRSYAFRGLSVTEGLSDLVVNAIYKDSLGYVWLGTGNSLECFDGIHFKHYLIPGSDEKLKRVNAIAEMPRNELWMGNGSGLWRVSKQRNSLEPIARETIGYAVRSLLHDGKGILYIGTERGLFIYKGGSLNQIMIDPNMLSAENSIGGLNLGEDGILWMATENGLYSLRLSDRKIEAYHNVMEENFYILEGKVDIVVDNVCHTLTEGDFIHIEPGEVHYVKNAYDKPIKMVSTLAPYQEVDKVNVENPVY